MENVANSSDAKGEVEFVKTLGKPVLRSFVQLDNNYYEDKEVKHE